MKILIVSPYPVFPSWSGGKIRIVAVARGLAECGHDVTVASPYHPRQRWHDEQAGPVRFRQFAYPFLFAAALRGRPFPYLHLASFHPGLRAVLAPQFHGYDVVQFEHAAFAALVPAVPPGVIVGYDAHNVEVDYLRHECPSRAVSRTVERRIRRLEGMLLQGSRHVFVVSRSDEERFGQLYPEHASSFVQAPNGIAAVRTVRGIPAALGRRCLGLERFASRAIYSGSNVAHNIRAVRFLLEQVAPSAGDVGFIIHGGCGLSFAGRTRPRNVFFDHDHRSFAAYAGVGTVGVNPVLTGGGTNLKLLHYLSHGMPVLSTPFGMRGYQDLEPFVRCCDREGFADALRAGVFPPPPPADFLMERYAWRTIAARMAAAYDAASRR